MSVTLALGLGFFVLTAIASVLGVGFVSGYRNTANLLTEKAELLVSAELQQVRYYLDAAQSQADFIASEILSEEVEPGPGEEFVSLLLGTIAATPQIIRIQYTAEGGRIFATQRLDGELAPLFSHVGDDNDLARRIERAREEGRGYWGDLLWRQEYSQGTLNYHRPVILDGEFRGVVSVLVSLEQLSELISSLDTDFGVNAFILHGRESVLAHPMMAFGYPGLNRQQPLPRQGAFTDPVITALWQPREERSLGERMMQGPGIRFVQVSQSLHLVLFREMEDYAGETLLVGTHFPALDMMSEILRLKWAIIACLLIAVGSSLAAAFIGRRISLPVRRLSESATRVHNLELSEVKRIPGSFFRELNDAGRAFNAMLDGLRWFERYVPKSLVSDLIRVYHDRGIESEFREVSIMFIDIAGFSRLSESMGATDVAAYLNDQFTRLAYCIENEGGTVDKYIGDGLLAIWGAPDIFPDAADRTLRAALAIRATVASFNAVQGHTGGTPVRLRIGIHQGEVMVGNIGSPGRINYTVVGDPVNVANRIEEMGHTLGDLDADVNILMSGAFRDRLETDCDVQDLGEQPIRGRDRGIRVYSLPDSD